MYQRRTSLTTPRRRHRRHESLKGLWLVSWLVSIPSVRPDSRWERDRRTPADGGQAPIRSKGLRRLFRLPKPGKEGKDAGSEHHYRGEEKDSPHLEGIGYQATEERP